MSPPALSLPLRVWREGDSNENSLSTLIQRINEQKGQFRNVTEQSLEEEIHASTSGDDAVEGRKSYENDEISRDGEDEVGRKETLLAAKEDILKQVGIAYMEAYYALDFVSLLLSKHTPRQAELSMSQHLKQHVLLGTLGAEKVQAQQESPEVVKDQELVCKGWKLQSLSTAADALIQSATRLETEIEQETRYWEEILAIDKKRWSLCRLPRERHTLGVRFGFLEATTEFRERGLAALRRGDNGKVVLDQGFNNSAPKAIRVRIENTDGKIKGSSTISSMIPPDTSSVKDLILQARNSIYEEELYHELGREARILTNQGVRIHDSAIVLTLPDQQQILIDLVALNNDEASSSSSQDGTTTQNNLAQAIALTLRLLLSHAHRQNHHRRTQLPPPLTDRKRPVPAYSLLRPVLAHLLHQHIIRSLRSKLQSLLSPLRLASLPARITLEIGVNWSLPPKDQTTPENIISTFTSPNKDGLKTLFHLSLPHQTTLTLQIHTLLYPPVLGTEYIITATADHSEINTDMRFTTSEETMRYIAYITTLALVDEIVSYNPKERDRGDRDTDREGGEWMRGSAFNEVLTVREKSRKRLVVLVNISGEEGKGGEAVATVEVRWCLVDEKMPTFASSSSSSSSSSSLATTMAGKGEGRYIWSGKDGEAGGKEQGMDMGMSGRRIRPFREVIENVARSDT